MLIKEKTFSHTKAKPRQLTSYQILVISITRQQCVQVLIFLFQEDFASVIILRHLYFKTRKESVSISNLIRSQRGTYFSC